MTRRTPQATLRDQIEHSLRPPLMTLPKDFRLLASQLIMLCWIAMVSGCAHEHAGQKPAIQTDPEQAERAAERARRAEKLRAIRAAELAYWKDVAKTINTPELVEERRRFLRDHPVLGAVRHRLSTLPPNSELTPPVPVERPLPRTPERETDDDTDHFGYFLMALVIAADGSVSGVYRMPDHDSRLPPEYETLTLRALRTWRFEPARYDGVATECVAVQLVRFTVLRAPVHARDAALPAPK